MQANKHNNTMVGLNLFMSTVPNLEVHILGINERF